MYSQNCSLCSACCVPFIKGPRKALSLPALVPSVLGSGYFCPVASGFPDLVECVAKCLPAGSSTGTLWGKGYSWAGGLAYYLSSCRAWANKPWLLPGAGSCCPPSSRVSALCSQSPPPVWPSGPCCLGHCPPWHHHSEASNPAGPFTGIA